MLRAALPGEQTMPEVQHVGLEEILEYFDDLEDPRDTVNRKHPLVSVVVIAMMAVLGGAGGPTAIARWAALKAEFLTRVLPLPCVARNCGRGCDRSAWRRRSASATATSG